MIVSGAWIKILTEAFFSETVESWLNVAIITDLEAL